MRQGKRPTVIIAEDHRFVAEAARDALEPEFEVVGIVENGQELLKVVQELKPDAVVMDIGMPLMNGLEAGQILKSFMKDVRLLYLSVNLDVEIAVEAFRRGASGYLPKTATASELPVALREVLKGRCYISPLITSDKVEFMLAVRTSRSRGSELTPRQREVLQLVAEGKSMKEIACNLGMTVRTVGFHKQRIKNTLGLRTTAELVQYAVRNHLVFPSQ